MTGIEVNSEAYFPKLREYCPHAFGTWAIFPQLWEIRLTIDLDASHYLYISLHHVTRCEPITAAHFDRSEV